MLGLRSLINLCSIDIGVTRRVGITSTPAFVPLVVLQDNCEFH